ncbi:hypothetical protein N8862_03480, partial [Pseudomonadales bacterium]|nr:hypothetical protein [Pseudomonadales bacterium]
VYTAVVTYAILKLTDALVGNRVSEEDEQEGLDIQGLKRHLTELLAKVHPTKTKRLFLQNRNNPALNAHNQIEPAND